MAKKGKHSVKKIKKVFAENIKGEEGFIVGHYGVAVDVRLDGGETRTCRVKRKAGHVVGDRVTVSPNGLKHHDRRTELRRYDAGGGMHVVAANLDVLGVVIASAPAPVHGFLDRALVSARASGITPFVVINKKDLPGAELLLAKVVDAYGDNFRIFMVSASDGEGVDEIRQFLAQGHRGAFIGGSGVGKSSLLNALIPELNLQVGEINEDFDFGRHTTTASTLNYLPDGGELIDTPGFRDFGVVDISTEELAFFFPDFDHLFNSGEGCKFGDCRHRSEPGCLIREGIKNETVKPERHQLYLDILQELEGVEEKIKQDSWR